MDIQRAVVKGTIGGIVETRSIYTADLSPSGGDTHEVLWDAYLTVLYPYIEALQSTIVTTYSYELQFPAAGHWEPFLEVPFVAPGTLTGEALANAVACVLIGKGEGLRHMGRKFISALAESAVNGNTIATGLVATAASALAAYITPLTGIGGGVLTPGVVDAQGNFHRFVGGIVSTLLGSIRRRKPGHGI